MNVSHAMAACSVQTFVLYRSNTFRVHLSTKEYAFCYLSSHCCEFSSKPDSYGAELGDFSFNSEKEAEFNPIMHMIYLH